MNICLLDTFPATHLLQTQSKGEVGWTMWHQYRTHLSRTQQGWSTFPSASRHDIDCFYAQSEELRCPSLRGRPLGVTQKFLVVTSNYIARGLGVPKMVSIDEAKRKLPSLVLINGEDLTPYRADSKRITAVLRRFGRVERLGLDEGAVDITSQVQARLRLHPPALSFTGHVLGLRTMPTKTNGPQKSTLFNFESMPLNCEVLPPSDVSLLVGSQVVADIRIAIEKETGFRCSCGIAQNKMLAKLSSSLNKPSMQTCLLQGSVAEFLAPLSVRKLPGVGKQMQDSLTDFGVETIADLRKLTLKQLSERLGDRISLFLFNACRGRDPTPVMDKGPPKSISVEDSFRNCQTMQHAAEILRVLAPDLIRRLDEDRQETGRRPKSLTLKWRVHGTKWNFISTSTQMPLELVSASVAPEKRAFVAVDVAMKLLSRNLGEPFHLVVLNMGATNFVSESSSNSPGVCDIRSFLQGQGKSPGKELKVISKRDARANRESFKAMATNAPAAGMAPPLIFQTSKPDTRYGPKRKLQDWDGSTVVQLEDDYHVSNSSEEEEVDDQADQLRLFLRQNSSKQRDVTTMQRKGRAYSFQEQEDFQVQHAKLSNTTSLSTSGLELSCHFPGVSGKTSESGGKEMIMSCSESKGPLSITAQSNLGTTTESLLASQFADDKPPATLKLELLGTSDKDVPGSPEQLSEAQNLAKSCFNGNSEHRLNSTSKRDSSPRKMSAIDANIRSDQPGLPVKCARSECGFDLMESSAWSVCEDCGEYVEESDSGRQEHADYHFALTLDKQGKNPMLRRPESSRGRDKLEHSAPSKKPKTRNSTLDNFVQRRP